MDCSCSRGATGSAHEGNYVDCSYSRRRAEGPVPVPGGELSGPVPVPGGELRGPVPVVLCNWTISAREHCECYSILAYALDKPSSKKKGHMPSILAY